MIKSLKTFHFDPEKSGRVLKGYVKSYGMSYQRVADELGYTPDTINNSISGKIKELSLERVFKICVLTGHSVCEYLRDMLQGEDIDFADQIHVLRDANLVLTQYQDQVPADSADTGHVLEATTVTAIEQSPLYQAAYQAMMQQASATHQANLDRFRRIHEGYVGMLESAHKKALEDQERVHREHIETVRKVARQRLRWIIILTVILLAVTAWFVWDLTHPEIGFIRLKQAGYLGRLIGMK